MKLAIAAFIKAQKEFNPAVRNAQNPHFRNRYADLSACLDAVLPALNANSLALVQQIHDAENGVTVETILMHESGESINFGQIFVPVGKHDAQGYGSALTYARRYGLMLLGIAPEDDDGNAAAKSAPVPKPKKEIKSKSQLLEVMNSPVCSTDEGLRDFYKGLSPEERDSIRNEAATLSARLRGENA
jgi:hypothetical protein